MQISRIRLSDETSRLKPGKDAAAPAILVTETGGYKLVP
jgi:hypothetical protein